MHGHDFDGVVLRLKVARFFAHAVGQALAGQGAAADVHAVPVAAQHGHAVPVAAQHGHVAPGVALGVLVGQQFGNLGGALGQAGQIDDDGLRPFAPAAQGGEQGDAVFILGEYN